jgi:hypothetical protein
MLHFAATAYRLRQPYTLILHAGKSLGEGPTYRVPGYAFHGFRRNEAS